MAKFIPLQDINVFPGKRLVHAAYGTELAAHGAGVVMLWLPVFADSSGRLRVDGTFPLRLPVQAAAGIRHSVVQLPGAPYAFGNVSGVGGNLGSDDALLYILHVGKSQVFCRGDIT